MTDGRAPGTAQTDERSVRIFVSSTFLDMQRERNLLVKEVFPALRRRFRERGVEILEVDLRWGITKEQSERGETLSTLMAEVDRCRPYFIGLLGDRYGWVPPATALTEELRATYPALANVQGASVTAMEIIHGLATGAVSANRAMFFERDARWDWVKDLKPGERSAAGAEPSDHRAKLDQLKTFIRSKGVTLRPYRSPDEVAAAIADALGALLEAQFPERSTPSAFEQGARLHHAYARERRGLHIGAEANVASLDQWMGNGAAPAMLVTGASGGGKSALIANWIEHWRRGHPQDIVFEHYLGASPDSADPALLMRRLWEHLDRVTGGTVAAPAGNVDLITLAEALGGRLKQASAFASRRGGRVLVALDGLDKLADGKDLRWLVEAAPEKLLASTLDGESKRAAEARGWRQLNVAPLAHAQRAELVRSTLAGWGRAISPRQVELLLAHQLAGSPLFLKTVLDELRVSATNASLVSRLESYLGANDMPGLFDRVLTRLEADTEPGLPAKALPLIWAGRAGLEEAEVIAMSGATPLAWAILRNTIGDGLRDQAGRLTFSHDFFRNAVATRYLSNIHLRRSVHLAIARKFTSPRLDARQAEEAPYQLRAAEAWDDLQALLSELDNLHALHKRGGVELLSHWLPLKRLGRDPETLLCKEFFARARSKWDDAEIFMAGELDRFLDFAGARGAASLKLKQEQARAMERIFGFENQFTLMTVGGLAMRLLHAGDVRAARELQQRVVDAAERILDPNDNRRPHFLNDLGAICIETAEFARAKEALAQAVAGWSRLAGADSDEALESLSNLAIAVGHLGDLNETRRVQEHVLAARRRRYGDDHPSTLTIMHSLGYTLSNLGDHQAALALKRETVARKTGILGEDHPSTLVSMNNLAVELSDTGDRAGAIKLHRRVLDMRTRVLGPTHHETLASMFNLAALTYKEGDYANAESMQRTIVKNWTATLGADHPDTVLAMDDLARTLRARRSHSEAKQLNDRVLASRRKALGETHAQTLKAYGEVILTLRESGDARGALSEQKRLFEMLSRVRGAEHDDTLDAMSELARVYGDSGDYKRARDLLSQLHAIVRRQMGEAHPDTLRVQSGLAATLYQLGELKRALALEEQVLEIRRRVLGASHPDTRRSEDNVSMIRQRLRR